MEGILNWEREYDTGALKEMDRVGDSIKSTLRCLGIKGRVLLKILKECGVKEESERRQGSDRRYKWSSFVTHKNAF
jgi:hypothetical protein